MHESGNEGSGESSNWTKGPAPALGCQSAPSCPSPFSSERHRYQDAIDRYGRQLSATRASKVGDLRRLP